MTIAAVHQVVPSLRPHDAVGAHTLRLRDLLRSTGLRSTIFSDDVDPALVAEAQPIAALPPPDRHGTAIVYQCSIGNEVVDLLLERPEPLVVNYHNLTPVAQLLRWAPDMAHLVGWGRSQLAQLATRSVLGIGDSEYNTSELRACGFTAAATAPILLADATFAGAPVRDRTTDWLFVGRIVPNKAQHDVLLAFAWHLAHHDPSARLRLVGSVAAPRYHDALLALIDRLDLGGSVVFEQALDEGALAAAYATAGVFVCLSDHEGFCIPILEALAHDLPVVAHAAAAVPETLGGAGLLLDTKDPVLVATAAQRVLHDATLRTLLVARGRERLDRFRPEPVAQQHLAALRSALPLAR